MNRYLLLFIFCLGGVLPRMRAENAAPEPLSYTVTFIEVEPGVRLEVLDWGGSGSAMVFLHGSGCTAHIFEGLAPKFLPRHRVIAITRRGAGASGMPKTGYNDERFGRDILAVLGALHISRPVLVGHSMAGAEMSWLNKHFLSEFAAFVYLDAAGPTAFYSEFSNDPGYFPFEMLEMRQQLDRLVPGSGELHPKQTARDILQRMPALQEGLTRWLDNVKDFPEPSAEQLRSMPSYMRELALNLQRYPTLSGKVLAIFPVPEGARVGPLQLTAPPAEKSLSQIDAFEYGVPGARVIRIPGATHFVFQTNEAEVVRYVESFVDSLRD